MFGKNPNAHLFFKKFKKVLDKNSELWYNNPVDALRGQINGKNQKSEKSSKKSLTKIQKHDIITPLMRSKSKSTRQGKGGKSQPLYI